MKIIDIGRAQFRAKGPLRFDQTHLFRGHVAHRFSEYEIVHNRDLSSGKCQYRYPPLQYKIVGGVAMIVAVGQEAIDVLERIFCGLKEITLARETFSIERKSLEVSREPFGMAHRPIQYRLATPWIALDSENYREYVESGPEEKDEILYSSLIGNLIRIAKAVRYEVPERIAATYSLKTERVVLKGQTMIGFTGALRCNFTLPDFLGIGKSCSRGYGCCLAVPEP